MTFSRPSIGSLGIERSARPGAPLRRLWDITWKATTAVVGDRWELLPAVAHPHITIAYAGRDAPDDAWPRRHEAHRLGTTGGDPSRVRGRAAPHVAPPGRIGLCLRRHELAVGAWWGP